MKHSPESWILDEKGSQIRDCDGNIIVDFLEHSQTDENWNTYRRIVACVNACKNIPTEALESFMSKIRVALAWTGGQDDDFMRNMAVVRAVREAGKIIEDAGGDYEVLT